MPIKVSIVGISGNIGKQLESLSEEKKEFTLVGGISAKNSNNADYAKICSQSDVIIDFSYCQSIEKLLPNAISHKVPLVIGTTGHSKSQLQMIMEASKEIPIFHSSNFSIGVHLLKKLIETLCSGLPEYSISLIEWHKLSKKDSPSGTALSLIREIQKHTVQKVETTSIRAGNNFCEHSLFFTDDAERLTVKHEICDKKIFAKAALDAALFILSKPVGYYEMEDLIGGLTCKQ